MKRVFVAIAVVVLYLIADVPVSHAMPALSCGSSGCWDNQVWCWYNGGFGCVQPISGQWGIVGYDGFLMTSNGSSLENITNGSDMGAVVFDQMTSGDNHQYFIQTGLSWNGPCGSGYQFYWRDSRPGTGGNHTHCVGNDVNVSDMQFDVEYDKSCGFQCADFYVYIDAWDGTGFDPCNPCVSTNDGTSFDWSEIHQVMYNGPDYTSNYPLYFQSYAIYSMESSGQIDYQQINDSNPGGNYVETKTGGAPPPDQIWIQHTQPYEDCLTWHSNVDTCKAF